MNKIAHRGNTQGSGGLLENDPSYITSAILQGHYCEVDVWFVEGGFWLGHDTPDHSIAMDFLENEKLICHAKNIEALHNMLNNPEIHCFWHENDKVTLTSKGFVWKYPEVYFGGKLWGVCSDWL